ncbi:substrate-binding domain-containing protein [Crassaminicella profunda]|uniref:substrate-binding domain-containing protein n=1 Tax=Crassaminicella profunda TaxID=1286698 RepID=UPI001CA6783F|nr:substrate-binding domain-containing protein [Crassaminicella profunda]QZY54689.1 substrate-binding domain-containing protein [Crassaminicella profunda]
MKKSTLGCILLFLIVFLLPACSSNQSNLDDEIDQLIEKRLNKEKSIESLAQRPITDKEVFVILKKDVFFKNIAKTLTPKLEKEGYNVHIQYSSDSDQRTKEEIEAIEEAISSKAEGIIISPGDSTSLIDSLKEAQDQGIKMVILDKEIDKTKSKEKGLSSLPYLHIDNETSFYNGVKSLENLIKEPTEVLMLLGNQNSSIAVKRKLGGLRAIEEIGNLHIASMEDGLWRLTNGYEITKKSFSKNPNIKVILSGNDSMALGALQYIEEANLKDVIITGFDGLPKAKESVKKGNFLYTIEQDAKDYAKKSAETIIKLMNKESVPEDIIIDTHIITK